jgi:hypothetical protein
MRGAVGAHRRLDRIVVDGGGAGLAHHRQRLVGVALPQHGIVVI